MGSCEDEKEYSIGKLFVDKVVIEENATKAQRYKVAQRINDLGFLCELFVFLVSSWQKHCNVYYYFKTNKMNKRILQTILALIALVAIITGIWSIVPGIADNSNEISINANNPANIILDSNYRYYSGLWLGIGIALLWIIPTIEKQKSAFRLISCMIFVGGVGRVVSMLALAPPHPLFIFFTVIELLFPLLILMQNRIAASK